MAIFTPGPAAAAISGSIGGTTFSHNRGGAYIRRRAIPVNQQSDAQMVVRSAVSSMSMAWSELTLAQRLSWQTWAQSHPITNALGNQVTLSGHQAFVKLNTRLVVAAQTPISDPPLDVPPLALSSLVFSPDIGLAGFDLTFTPTPFDDETIIIVDAAVVDSVGITNVNSLWKRVLNSDASEAGPLDIEAEVTAVFGTLIAGHVCHVRAYTLGILTGLVSSPRTTSGVIVDTIA